LILSTVSLPNKIMLRVASICITFAGAYRTTVSDEIQLQTEFGASCDSLQNRFHDQTRTLRTAFNTRTSGSAVTQARLAMRMHGMMRTLRRAQECAWVVENDSEDMEELRGIMQELLAGNPCAEAARIEMETGASTDSNEAIPNAISILMSEDCQVHENQPVEDESTPEAQLQQAEEQLQDNIDEIMDAEDEGESLIQMDQSGRIQRFMKGVGVFFFMLFLLTACVNVAGMIGFFLAGILFFLANLLLSGAAAYDIVMGAIFFGATYGMFPATAVGLVGCAYNLYNNTLPRLVQ